MFRVKNKDYEWYDELLRRAEIAVESYEAYLTDKMNSKELAGVMKNLREVVRNIKRSTENYSEPLE